MGTNRKEYMRDYMRKYLKENPDKYKNILKATNEYLKTKRGRTANRIACERFRARNPNYMKDYCRNLRLHKKELGICYHCNDPAEDGKVSCRRCRKRRKKLKIERSIVK